VLYESLTLDYLYNFEKSYNNNNTTHIRKKKEKEWSSSLSFLFLPPSFSSFFWITTITEEDKKRIKKVLFRTIYNIPYTQCSFLIKKFFRTISGLIGVGLWAVHTVLFVPYVNLFELFV
jgi:hypothetical protein